MPKNGHADTQWTTDLNLVGSSLVKNHVAQSIQIFLNCNYPLCTLPMHSTPQFCYINETRANDNNKKKKKKER